MSTPKLGAKFNLCGVVWEVYQICDDGFRSSVSHEGIRCNGAGSLWLQYRHADQLDWIKEGPVTFSERQIEAIAKFGASKELCRWLLEHKEK